MSETSSVVDPVETTTTGSEVSTSSTSFTGSRPEGEPLGTRSGSFGGKGSGDTSGFGGTVAQVTFAAATPRPYGSWFDDAVDALIEDLQDAGIDPNAALERVVVERADGAEADRELTIWVAREHLLEVARALRDDQDLRFELSLGVSGVHYPQDSGRELHAVYHLTSITHGRRVRLEVTAPVADPHVPSTTGIYPANDWHERETYDFFGLIFDGHPGLARIAMPDDWPGHPQRKDYPLGGIAVEYRGATVPPPEARRSYP
jgi:NADH-quinone oxidoreductase subunit C